MQNNSKLIHFSAKKGFIKFSFKALVLDYVCICICEICGQNILYFLSCVVMFIIFTCTVFHRMHHHFPRKEFRHKDKLANANMIPLLRGFTVYVFGRRFKEGRNVLCVQQCNDLTQRSLIALHFDDIILHIAISGSYLVRDLQTLHMKNDI